MLPFKEFIWARNSIYAHVFVAQIFVLLRVKHVTNTINRWLKSRTVTQLMYCPRIPEKALQTRCQWQVGELAPSFVIGPPWFATIRAVCVVLILPGVRNARIHTAIDEQGCDSGQNGKTSIADVQGIKVEFMTKGEPYLIKGATGHVRHQPQIKATNIITVRFRNDSITCSNTRHR